MALHQETDISVVLAIEASTEQPHSVERMVSVQAWLKLLCGGRLLFLRDPLGAASREDLFVFAITASSSFLLLHPT